MSNSTYCEDHYEQPDWMKKIQVLEKQNKELRELLAKKEKEYIDKEIIRKEVERLRNLHQMKYQQLDADNSMSLVECGKRNLCNELLRFIDSMKEEPISEDERIRKQTLKVLNYYKDEEKSEGRMPTEIEECIVWIEKLGEKGTNGNEREIPNSTWSEEDEQTFIKSVEALEDIGKFELADWLKEHKNQCLTPQSQWKPSDEWVKALNIAIRCGIQLGTWEEDALKSLAEQLKKLRE